jgi:hypothetical protein
MPVGHYDGAVDDLSWRLGGAAEAEMGMRGQAVDGDRSGKRVFDDEASWRLMEAMCQVSRLEAIKRARRIDAALRLCPEHVPVLKLAFVPLRRRASAVLVREFTVGKVCLLGLAAASETAAIAYEHKREDDDDGVVDWLEREMRSTKSTPKAIFDRLRSAADEMLVPALVGYANAARVVHEEAKRREDKRISDIREAIDAGRPKRETAAARVARHLTAIIELNRKAGIE